MHDIKDSLKSIQKDIGEIRTDVAKNTVSLDAHMARTEINERRLEKLESVLIGIAVIGVLGGVIKLLIS